MLYIFSMNAVLVPTDFSSTAYDALEFAAAYSRSMGMDLHILHAVDPDMISDMLLDDDELKAEGERQIMELIKQPWLADLHIKPQVLVGNVCSTICKHADRINADIIIMGSEGAGNLGQMFVGSNAQRIVRMTERDVLTIKQRVEVFKMKKIVFASNFGEGTEKAFDHLFQYIRKFHPVVCLLMTNTRGQNDEHEASAMQKVNDFYERIYQKYPLEFEKVVVSASKKEFGIMEYAMKNAIDLIAIRTHGSGGIWRLFKDSLSQDLVNHSYRPVLTINVDDE